MTTALDKPHVTIKDALALLPQTGGQRFAEVFKHGSLTVEMYKPQDRDLQQPHTRDEVYIVASGTGMFVNGDTRHPFAAGDFLFVPAGVIHRFEDFSEGFATWVLFYGPEGGEVMRGEANG